jgi:tellurite resistance protein
MNMMQNPETRIALILGQYIMKGVLQEVKIEELTQQLRELQEKFEQRDDEQERASTRMAQQLKGNDEQSEASSADGATEA